MQQLQQLVHKNPIDFSIPLREAVSRSGICEWTAKIEFSRKTDFFGGNTLEESVFFVCSDKILKSSLFFVRNITLHYGSLTSIDLGIVPWCIVYLSKGTKESFQKPNDK